MNDPIHQQRLTLIRNMFMSLQLKGELEQHESQPKGGHTGIRFILKHGRQQQTLRQAMKSFYDATFIHESAWVKLDRYSSFTVVRSVCTYCGKRWFEHTPSGEQCLFAPTKYTEHPRTIPPARK